METHLKLPFHCAWSKVNYAELETGPGAKSILLLSEEAYAIAGYGSTQSKVKLSGKQFNYRERQSDIEKRGFSSISIPSVAAFYSKCRSFFLIINQRATRKKGN
jgi:hypothetical protein